MAIVPRRSGEPDYRHRVFDYKPPRYLTYLRYALITVTFLAAASVLYSFYWYFTVDNLRTGIINWFAVQEERGYRTRHGAVETSGFPLAMRVRVASPELLWDDGVTAWLWQGKTALIELKPWNPWRTRIDASGDQNLTLAAGGLLRPYEGTAERLVAEVEITGDGQPDALALDVAGLALFAVNKDQPETARSGDRSAKPDIAAASLRLDAARVFDQRADSQEPSSTLTIAATKVRLPPFVNPPFGRDVDAFNFEGKVLGPVRLDNPAAGLAEWRDRGGTVEISLIEARYGPLYFRGHGTLALDAELQPVGAMTAKIEGFLRAVDALQEINVIRSRDAAMAKVVLGALARRSDDGEPSWNLPLTLQERKLYAGPISLVSLPRIRWPNTTAGPGFGLLP